MAVRLLHGTLQCTIYGAQDLVNEFRLTGAAPLFLRQVVGIVEQTVHMGRGPSRLYATVDLGKARVGRTRMVEGEPMSPVWMETFHIYCAHYASHVVISIKDDDTVGSHVVGRARIPVIDVLGGSIVEGVFDLYHDNGNKVKGGGRVRVRLQFFEIRRGSSEEWNVQPAYFTQRRRCHVKLYQDAHMQEGFLPRIYLTGDKLFEAGRCWEDISDAISAARIFIYIAGWSVFTDISLRRRGSAVAESIGDLLKRKADEGVTVAMLVWDDRTSISYIKPQGVMNTHDEETVAFFRNSRVKCVLCPRAPDAALSVIQGFQLSTMFTHHQKLVCVDGPCAPPSAARKVVSFIGGLDLCDGRYDDQRHSLFRTLEHEHANDFYQGSLRNALIATGGPRQPWHDIHCRLEGPVAWDVVENFEQRWRKQAARDAPMDLVSHPLLLPPTAPADEFLHDATNANAWGAQLFRSIDGGAAYGFPTNPYDASLRGLVSGKDHTIERSIQDAYIHAIRHAEHFIYIENQYFMGSCHAWDTMTEIGCLHLIPMEITLKIVNKIEAGERFVAYIVIPMWPEGIPDSNTVQPILDWQRRTMEMMYKQVALALRSAGKTNEKPTDYLCFFCLGNRETKLPDELQPQQSPAPDNLPYQLAQEYRRFMIYVHSKMMMVDDEYIILGSANINQRSMDGGRDTEIAVGAHQPFHTWQRGAPRGQVHGFRMSLWYEHLGRLDNSFLEPWSLQCVRFVHGLATELWDLYAAPESVDLPGHLLAYPVAIAEDGSVSEFPGQPYFPDTKASILGKQTGLPPILTS
ncbi:hypothetical protein GOP47_0022493 [Adiantum capillus-veneris]|uniref:Phospholipase D n=1 Tax=Adiantum capillus-veneris TaxID=13818 RepID=A0A9D4U5G1_ADICA|nr:hypothetical protein GOP47_0022493 [Adiantum capillus-veneris]